MIRVVLPLLLIGLLLCAGYYLFLDPYYSRYFQLRINDAMNPASEELANAHLLLAPINGGGIYTQGQLLYPEYFESGSVVLDVAYAPQTEVKILFVLSTRTYELRVNGELLMSANSMGNLFLSEDGSVAAIGVVDKDAPNFIQPELWSAYIIDIPQKKITEVAGFAVIPLDAESYLLFNGSGITEISRVTGEEKVVSAEPILEAYTSIAYDPTTSRIAWSTVLQRAYVYDLLRDSTTILAPLSQFDVTARTSIALSGDNVYLLIPQGEARGTKITRTSLFTGETVTIRTLPEILAVAKLIP